MTALSERTPPATPRVQLTGVRLTEEVPGVPEDERWFVSGGPFRYDVERAKREGHGYPHFRTREQAEQFLRDQGIPKWSVELLIEDFV